MTGTGKTIRLGDQLLDEGLITEAQLKLALKAQKRDHEPIGRILVHLGFITERVLAEKLAQQTGVPFVSLKAELLDKSLIQSVPPELARKHQFIPIRKDEDQSVIVAMANPTNVISVDAIQDFMGGRIQIVAALESEISAEIAAQLEWNPDEEIDQDPSPDMRTGSAAQLVHDDDSITEVMESVFNYALRNQATDIHIEPERNLLRVRYRIDGMLHPGETLAASMASPVITRLKIMSSMDITERRLPQDGRINMDYDKRKIDLRVSTMPTNHGENMVIRILDRGRVSLNLNELGVHPEMREKLVEMANLPYGMILVSGPTGSGKTTTLYAVLLSIDSMTRKIVTVEDPIEYELPLIRQSQVDPQINYSFAEGLRTILRQDPDVILVGEIRDRETADVAMRASLTGHVVLSSIHTNTALGVVPRLLDIGLDPFLITSSLSGVLAQRLVRRICSECKEPYQPSDEEIDWLGADLDGATLYRAKGCSLCRHTGYQKRTAIFELVRMNKELASVIYKGGSEQELEETARGTGSVFMADDGKRKVREGVTTIQEVLRVCHAI